MAFLEDSTACTKAWECEKMWFGQVVENRALWWKEKHVWMEEGKARNEVQEMTQLEQGVLEEMIFWRRLKGSGEMMQRSACVQG